MLVIIFVWGFVEKLLVTKKTIKNERIKKKMSYKQQLHKLLLQVKVSKKNKLKRFPNFFGFEIFPTIFFFKNKLTRFVEKMNLYYQLHD